MPRQDTPELEAEAGPVIPHHHEDAASVSAPAKMKKKKKKKGKQVAITADDEQSSSDEPAHAVVTVKDAATEATDTATATAKMPEKTVSAFFFH